MKGGVFNRPECCNQPCECPICLENKPLMRLNCNHYICLEDIQRIINLNPRRLQKCPICRVLITSYGCNGNIINLQNEEVNIIPIEEDDTDDDYVVPNRNISATGYNIVSDYESDENDDEIYGGKMKRKHIRKNKKKIKTKKLTSRKRITKKITLRKRMTKKIKKQRFHKV